MLARLLRGSPLPSSEPEQPRGSRFIRQGRNYMQGFTRWGMDNQERIKRLIKKLRDVTLAVQILPFIYAALYIVALVLYLFASDNTMEILDTMLYVSPAVIFGNLVLSRILELCRWHKSACIIPILPQLNIIIDRYIYELSSFAITAHLILIIAMLVLLLIAAYNVFLR